MTRRGAAFAFTWSAAVWFSVVYLGQHYVTDVIGGIVFALVTWLIMTQILVPMIPALQHKPVISELSSTDLDTVAPAVTQESATPLGSGGSDR